MVEHVHIMRLNSISGINKKRFMNWFRTHKSNVKIYNLPLNYTMN